MLKSSGSTTSGSLPTLVTIIGLCAAAAGLTGCDVDTFFDPSKPVRMENTPVVLPILERLDIIDEQEIALEGIDEIKPQDLIPIIEEYKLGVSDAIEVTIPELIQVNRDSVSQRAIDNLGYVQLPILGRVRATGRTVRQMEQVIKDLLHPNILKDPRVTVTLLTGRQDTYKILAPQGTGTYTIQKPEWRLLDALALARVSPEGADKIYVIRQTALYGEVVGKEAPDVREHVPPPPPTGEPYVPFDEENQPAEQDPDNNAEELLKLLQESLEGSGTSDATTPPKPEDIVPDEAQPLIEALEPEATAERPRWVNIDGTWVEVSVPPGAEPPDADDVYALPEDMALEELMTQRIIEVDVKQLMQGNASYNIIVRPGDTIRITVATGGFVFLGGEIARPGSYQIQGPKSRTLKEMILGAGGFGALAIPERIDLTRRVGPSQEATVRLNGRAIWEGVQPNIFLKPNDSIIIGTNFFAAPLLVARNGFRMSYGFGFLLDRNFAFDVYGPINNNNNNNNN